MSWFSDFRERLAWSMGGHAKTRDELVADLRGASQRDLLGADTLDMMERSLQVSEMQVREIMVPRSQMVVLDEDANFQAVLAEVVRSGHSRFPAIGAGRDAVSGILLAKELLHYCGEASGAGFHLRELLRPAVYVPGSKRLNVLLREFRSKRNHMAIVVDEYGGVAGLVTIEDVLEQIVGEITDETDLEVDAFIRQREDGSFNVKALTPVADFNQFFKTKFDETEQDTVGGLMLRRLGHLPTRDELLDVDGVKMTVLNADSRRIHLLRVQVGADAAATSANER